MADFNPIDDKYIEPGRDHDSDIAEMDLEQTLVHCSDGKISPIRDDHLGKPRQLLRPISPLS